MLFPVRKPEHRPMHRKECRAFSRFMEQNYERLFFPFADYVIQTVQAKRRERIAVLEVGSGPGLLARALHERSGGKENIIFIGIDASNEMVRYAREVTRPFKDRTSFLKGDVNALPFPEDSFDVVVCKDSFHEFVDAKKALREMMRVVRKGGWVIIQDIRRDVSEKWCPGIYNPKTHFEWIRFYSFRASYTLEEMRRIMHSFSHASFSLTTLFLTKRRRRIYGRYASDEELRRGFRTRFVLKIRK